MKPPATSPAAAASSPSPGGDGRGEGGRATGHSASPFPRLTDFRATMDRARALGLISSISSSGGRPVSIRRRLAAPTARQPHRSIFGHRLLVEKIQHATCGHFKITLGEMLHDSRLTADVSWARAVAVHLCSEILTINRHDLAAAFHRTPAAIKYMRDLVAYQIVTRPSAAAEINFLQTMLQEKLKSNLNPTKP